jgi:hypothetical protein
MVAHKSKRVAVDLPLWFMSSCSISAKRLLLQWLLFSAVVMLKVAPAEKTHRVRIAARRARGRIERSCGVSVQRPCRRVWSDFVNFKI